MRVRTPVTSKSVKAQIMRHQQSYHYLGQSWKEDTMWRYSAYTPIEPDPPIELYFIPILIGSGQPQMIKNERQYHVVPGWFSIIKGLFELSPECDCLLAGDTSKAC